MVQRVQMDLLDKMVRQVSKGLLVIQENKAHLEQMAEKVQGVNRVQLEKEV